MTTPSQTAGPFFEFGLVTKDGAYAVAEGEPDAFWVRGTVLDGAGEPVPDAMVETWQADPSGHYHHPDDPGSGAGFGAFTQGGFARSGTDSQGRWAILTVRPGPVPGPDDSVQAPHPHLAVSVFARGLLNRVVTRMYFPEEAEANATDPVLSVVASEDRASLVAEPAEDGYRFDIRLQGEHETVFFRI
jgi:protocatechuate 3,4-dioxygenase alpha subunit